MDKAFVSARPGPFRCALLLFTVALAVGDRPVAQAQQPTESVAGTIDVHTHSAPDDRPRSIDVIDLAKLAKARGMRGIVVKDHYAPTASVAYIIRKLVPGLEVFGGITMDLTNGGVNPAAVENMAKTTGGWGRIVWMPTFDAEAASQPGPGGVARPFASVSRNGELLPVVKEVIAIIAQHNMVLATGHSSPAENLLLVREGRKRGVKGMILTHPITSMTVPQMQECAKEGSFIELTAISLLGAQATVTATDYARVIRSVGPDHVILSSDLGQPGNPLHPDGFAALIASVRAQGFSQRDLDMMTKENPAKLLGLPIQ